MISLYKRIVFSALFIACLYNYGWAQDAHLSQYEASPQHLNPAMTGMFEGDFRFNVHYRNQWSNLITKPFVTSAMSFDMPYKKAKLGAFVLNNRAGAGNYNVLNFVVSGAYDYSFKNHPSNHISGGIQLGVIQKSVNMANLYFDTQYSAANGGGFDPNQSNGENFSNVSIWLPELNLGMLYYYSRPDARINPFLGFSVHHITEPNESFFTAENKLPRRYVLHGGIKLNVNERIQISTHLLGMQQTNVKETTASLLLYYYFRDSDTYLLLGGTGRRNDAFIMNTGLKYGSFTYRVSYDINTSTLQRITNGRGGFELSIVYIIKKVDANPIKPCPRL